MKTDHFSYTEINNLSQKIEILICTEKLFPDEKDDWSFYEYDKGRLRLRLNIVNALLGVSAYAALWVPPSDRDMSDAWEGSREKGEADWWSFLYLTCYPDGEEYKNIRLGVYFSPETFFNRSLERVIEIKESPELEEEFYALSRDFMDTSFLADKSEFHLKIQNFINILSVTYGAEVLNEKDDVWEIRYVELMKFLEDIEKSSQRKEQFYKGLSFSLGHIYAQIEENTWREIKNSYDHRGVENLAAQVRDWRGDRSPESPIYWAFEIIASGLEAGCTGAPAADKYETLIDEIMDRAADD
jgi:hypothetical protein